MAPLRTDKTTENAKDFVTAVADARTRADCLALWSLMGEVTQQEPAMWGKSIVGFGSYHYRYDSGREGDWFLTGFAPRKRNLTIYVIPGLAAYGPLVAKLGACATGKSCLYIKRLEHVDVLALRTIIEDSVAKIRAMYA